MSRAGPLGRDQPALLVETQADEATPLAGGDWSFAGMPGGALGRASFKETRLREADLTLRAHPDGNPPLILMHAEGCARNSNSLRWVSFLDPFNWQQSGMEARVV